MHELQFLTCALYINSVCISFNHFDRNPVYNRLAVMLTFHNNITFVSKEVLGKHFKLVSLYK